MRLDSNSAVKFTVIAVRCWLYNPHWDANVRLLGSSDKPICCEHKFNVSISCCKLHRHTSGSSRCTMLLFVRLAVRASVAHNSLFSTSAQTIRR